MKNLKFYDSFLWIKFNYLNDTEPLPGDSLFFTIKLPGLSGTHLINFSHPADLNPGPWIGNPVP